MPEIEQPATAAQPGHDPDKLAKLAASMGSVVSDPSSHAGTSSARATKKNGYV